MHNRCPKCGSTGVITVTIDDRPAGTVTVHNCQTCGVSWQEYDPRTPKTTTTRTESTCAQ